MARAHAGKNAGRVFAEKAHALYSGACSTVGYFLATPTCKAMAGANHASGAHVGRRGGAAWARAAWARAACGRFFFRG